MNESELAERLGWLMKSADNKRRSAYRPQVALDALRWEERNLLSAKDFVRLKNVAQERAIVERVNRYQFGKDVSP